MNIYLLKKLHYILKPFDNICPRNCNSCEEHETAILLPNEEKLLSFDPKKIEKFIAHKDGFYYIDTKIDCPYFLNTKNNSKCLIYGERFLDCRIFPFYPRFDISTNSYTLMRSNSYCSLDGENIIEMQQAVKKALNIINELVPNSWKEVYNKLNYERLLNESDKQPHTIRQELLATTS